MAGQARGWDVTALINGADPKAPLAERHLWAVRLLEWLRHAPLVGAAPADTSCGPARTPLPVLRLRHLLNLLDRHPDLLRRAQGMVTAFWGGVDAATLYADFGFGTRRSLAGELLARIQARVLPATPETADLGALFCLLFEPDDATWVAAIDEPTLRRAAGLFGPGAAATRAVLLDAIAILAGAVRAAGQAPALRLRMDPADLQAGPLRQLTAAAATLRQALEDGHADAALQAAAYLRALLDGCRRAAAGVLPHLEEYGVSVHVVFELEQLQARTERMEQILDCLLAPEPADEGRRLLVELMRAQRAVQGVRELLARHYSLLARLVAERSAETGAHYITRDRGEYRAMLRRAAGGGAVVAGTTLVKFALATLALSAFWGGFWAGANYALSFVVIMLLGMTLATKQPAMTAPALAAMLPRGGSIGEAELRAFVDRVAAMIRSQVAGIVGNVAVCAPLVLAAQGLARALFGLPIVEADAARHVLHDVTLLGPAPLFAAFTGVLLFASSLVAGWSENWFVLHRLDSAIAHNPRIVARLGTPRARRWAAWWRANVSGLAANVSLGMMLGLLPPLAGFVGLPLEVRHVTLASGQLGAALGAQGPGLLREAAFWWCVAGIAVTGALNLTVSFALAFSVALRSRGVKLYQRAQIVAALGDRLRHAPLSFVLPPRG